MQIWERTFFLQCLNVFFNIFLLLLLLLLFFLQKDTKEMLLIKRAVIQCVQGIKKISFVTCIHSFFFMLQANLLKNLDICKVNITLLFPLRKCRVSCVGGILDRRCVHVGVQEIIYAGEDFNARRDGLRERRSTAEELRRCATLGSGLVPDNPRLKGREEPELMRLVKIEKRGESKMMHCLEMALTRK